MRTTIAMLITAATLAACGTDKPGPAAQAFNKEREVADAQAAAGLRTRMVKPPRLVNGGYPALPGAIRSGGEVQTAGATPTPVPATPGRGYLVQPASQEPPAPDPLREAALRRPDPRRAGEIRRGIAEAEARRKKVVAAQAKRIADERSGRRQDLRRTDREAFKRYRPPVRVQVAPAKGSGVGKPRAGATTTPAPRPTGTPRPQSR